MVDGDEHVVVREPGKPVMRMRRGQVTKFRPSFPDESEPESKDMMMRRTAGCAASGPRSTVRVGVFHTEAAAVEAGGSAAVMRDVRAAIAEANAVVLPLSGINVTLELCSNGRVDVAEGSRPGESLDLFVRDRSVRVIQVASDCDAVVMYASSAALGHRSCGIGQLPGTHSVVSGACFTDNYSFLHELGHNLAACHYGCEDYRSAYGDAENNFRTIMSYRSVCSGCPRIGRFSNALDFSYGGNPIGDRSHDNARTMNAMRGVLEGRQC